MPAGFGGECESDRDSGWIPEGNPRQLTIFFNGQICVLNDVSPEKVRRASLLPSLVQAFLMIAAATAARAASASPDADAADSPVAASLESPRSPSFQSSPEDVRNLPSQTMDDIPTLRCSQLNLQSGLPLARRSSLLQFLEKRRGRAVDRTPYRRPAKTWVKDAKKDSGSHASTPSASS
ncbi:protein TIFY 3-like [Wolffia australiana]